MRKFISIITLGLLIASSAIQPLAAETLDVEAISLQLSMELKQSLKATNVDTRSVLLLRDNEELSSSTHVCSIDFDELSQSATLC